jgi:hypothetical protein
LSWKVPRKVPEGEYILKTSGVRGDVDVKSTYG